MPAYTFYGNYNNTYQWTTNTTPWQPVLGTRYVSPDPPVPTEDDNIIWLKGRVQEMVDIFDKAAA